MLALIGTPATTVVVFFVGLVSLFSLWRYLEKKACQLRLPPGPRGLPLVGSLPFLNPNLHRQFADLARSYGPVLSLRLGSKLCVVVSSPSAVREIFKDQDVIFANHDVPSATRFHFGTSPKLFWSPYGPQWRMLRQLAVRHVLSSASIQAREPVRKEEVRRAVAAVWEKAKAGSAVDVREILFHTTLNATTTMLWGERLTGDNGVGLRFWQAVEELVNLLKPNVADFFPVVARFDPQGLGKRVRRQMEWVHSYLDRIVERKKKETEEDDDREKNSDVMESMLDLMRRKDPLLATFTLKDLKNFVMDIIVASTDTNTTTMEWALTELLMHPKVMIKVQQELGTIIGKDRTVEESDIPKLHFLSAVLKETLRLHPPVPLLIPHRPSTDCTVGGFSIPVGTAVFVNVWAIQRDPLIWTDPAEFKPERFFEKGMDEKWDHKGGSEFNYLPFGAGRRACAGIQLAERIIMYLLASLLHSFDWKLPEGAEQLVRSEKFGIVLRKAENLVAVPTMKLDNVELYA